LTELVAPPLGLARGAVPRSRRLRQRRTSSTAASARPESRLLASTQLHPPLLNPSTAPPAACPFHFHKHLPRLPIDLCSVQAQHQRLLRLQADQANQQQSNSSSCSTPPPLCFFSNQTRAKGNRPQFTPATPLCSCSQAPPKSGAPAFKTTTRSRQILHFVLSKHRLRRIFAPPSYIGFGTDVARRPSSSCRPWVSLSLSQPQLAAPCSNLGCSGREGGPSPPRARLASSLPLLEASRRRRPLSSLSAHCAQTNTPLQSLLLAPTGSNGGRVGGIANPPPQAW
jgi:hypothetical protein